MRNWLIAMAVSGILTGLSHTASAQEIKRTGGGSAKSECFASWGSCGGLGPEVCSGPDCNVSVSGNGTIFPGFDGQANLNMSAMSIQVSGNASFTPPSPCAENTFTGGPGYIADGSQSIYADVPNGTQIRITITSSLSGGATWSDAKSGTGGVSGTTVFNTTAGPGKITDAGVDYYLIDTIRANGIAGASRKCDEPNDQSFSGSLGLSFCVTTGKMKAVSSTELTALVDTPVELKVQVNNGCTNAPISGQSISFSGADPAGGQNFSLESSAQTDTDGFATVSFTPSSTPGAYSISAFCSACGANRQVTFTVTVLTNEEARALIKRFGDGSGPVGTRLDNPLSVRVMNTVTGVAVPSINVNFEPVGNCPGFSANPNFTATDEYGLARAFVSLPPEPGSCVYRASCESCLSNQEVLFSVAAVVPPDIPIDQTPSGAGPSRSGGGPSTSSGGRGSGGSGPLGIEYNAIGPGFRLLSAPESVFIGILTEDPIRLRAFPREDSFQWSGPAGAWSQAEISVAFNQQFDATNPALETVTRTSDGKAVTARLIVQPRPSGDGEIAATLASLKELCIEADSPLNCLMLKIAHSEAYKWAKRTFEPHGRSDGSCGNNCCDAGKHMYWHAFITRFVGESYSIRHGDAHEKTNLDSFDPHNEIVMDLHNNVQGRVVGRTSTTETEIEFGVLTRIRSGQALVLQNVANRDRQSLLEFSHICGQ